MNIGGVLGQKQPFPKSEVVVRVVWIRFSSIVRGYGTLRYGDAREKYNFFEIKELIPLKDL